MPLIRRGITELVSYTYKELRIVRCVSDLLPRIRIQRSVILVLGKGGFISKSRYSEAQMTTALKQLKTGLRVEDVAREYGVSKLTTSEWTLQSKI